MNFEKELIYLNEQKDTIILNWFNTLDVHFPNNNLLAILEPQANLLFQFTCDFHIPVKKHSLIKHIPEWCDEAYYKHMTISNSLISFNYWRDSFVSVLLEYTNSDKAAKCIKIVLSRLGEFEVKFCEVFWHKSKESLEEKDRKIDRLHDDRLNLIGKMASSMAHEIRNPLTSIAGFLKLIRQNITSSSQAKLLRYIDVIDDEFDSINMQITGFLSFSRNKAFEEKKIKISGLDLINSTLFLLIPRFTNENIHFTIDNDEECMIFVQKISIQQVLSNIISNAIDELITVDYERVIKIECRQDGEYVYIQITNNGSEIQKEMKDSLYEPFVTNKENGTGLGLTISKEIMTKNNGTIDFKSDDKETSFILTFNKQIDLGHSHTNDQS